MVLGARFTGWKGSLTAKYAEYAKEGCFYRGLFQFVYFACFAVELFLGGGRFIRKSFHCMPLRWSFAMGLDPLL